MDTIRNQISELYGYIDDAYAVADDVLADVRDLLVDAETDVNNINDAITIISDIDTDLLPSRQTIYEALDTAWTLADDRVNEIENAEYYMDSIRTSLDGALSDLSAL